MFEIKFVEKLKTHFMLNFFNRAVYEVMWKKYCRAGHATYGNMAHALCKQYRNTHSVYVVLSPIAFPQQ